MAGAIAGDLGSSERAAVRSCEWIRYDITYRMEPHHHHHHHPGRAHPPAAVSASILRLSSVERLAIVSVLIAALWGAVLWAMAS